MDYMDYMGCKLDLSFLCVLVSFGIRGEVVLTNKLSFMDPHSNHYVAAAKERMVQIYF